MISPSPQGVMATLGRCCIVCFVLIFANFAYFPEVKRLTDPLRPEGIFSPVMIGVVLVLAAIAIFGLLIGFKARACASVLILVICHMTAFQLNSLSSNGVVTLDVVATEITEGLAVIGGLLMIVSLGAGKYSLDFLLAYKKPKSKVPPYHIDKDQQPSAGRQGSRA